MYHFGETQLEDGTIARTINNLTFHTRFHGNIYYHGLDDEYFHWVNEQIQKNLIQLQSSETIFSILNPLLCSSDDPVFTPGDLADRWNLSWKIIKKIIESGYLTLQFIPLAKDILSTNSNDNTTIQDKIKYIYKVIIPWEDIKKIEESYPQLKEIALKHNERVQKREEEHYKKLQQEQDKKINELNRTCKAIGWTIDNVIDHVKNIQQTMHDTPAVDQQCMQKKSPDIQGTPLQEGPGKAPSKRWLASVTTACKAVLEVCQSGRKDWVRGLESSGNTDSAGKETFCSLLHRLHQSEDNLPVLSQVEKAAWAVLSQNGMTWPGGKKPQKKNA